MDGPKQRKRKWDQGPSDMPPRTLILWLHGLGDEGSGWHALQYEMKEALPSHTVWQYPTAPEACVTCDQSEKMTSWFDLLELPITPDSPHALGEYEQAVALIHMMLDGAIAQGFQPENIFVGGFSQGAALALGSVLSYGHTLRGAICLSGWVVGLEDGSFEKTIHSANRATHCFWGHGGADPTVATGCQVAAAPFLKRLGVLITACTYPSLGHSVCAREYEDLSKWFIGQCAAR